MTSDRALALVVCVLVGCRRAPASVAEPPASAVVRYVSFESESLNLAPLAGEHVTLLFAKEPRSAEVWTPTLNGLDRAYEFHLALAGRAPFPSHEGMYDGRILLAEMAGGDVRAHVGVAGIEWSPSRMEAVLRAREKGESDVVPLYELATNFWFAGPSLDFVSAPRRSFARMVYAVASTRRLLETTGERGGDFDDAPYKDWLAQLRDWSARYGGDGFARRLYRRAVMLPAVTRDAEAVDNFVAAASWAAGVDLSAEWKVAGARLSGEGVLRCGREAAEGARRPVPRAALGRGTGLTGQYFTGMFAREERSQLDAQLDFHWGWDNPAKVSERGFSVRWEGALAPRETADHLFLAHVDGGVRVWVDGALVLDSLSDVAWSEVRSRAVALNRGAAARVRVEFYKTEGEAALRLFWYTAASGMELIPSAQWTPRGAGPDS